MAINCATCAHGHKDPADALNPDMRGRRRCRRFPPVAVIVPGGAAFMSPPVVDDQTCGEWRGVPQLEAVRA